MRLLRKPLHMFPKGLFLIFVAIVFVLLSPLRAQENTDFKLPIKLLEKGRWHTGLTFSLNNRIAENEDQLLRQVVDQNRLSYDIDVLCGYFIKDAFSTGLNLSYGRNREDISFIQDNREITRNTVGYTVGVSPFIRNYITLGKTQYMALFNQTAIRFKFGEELTQTIEGQNIDKILSDVYSLELGISPGVIVFIEKGFAFEVLVDLLGLSTTVRNSTKNYTDESRVLTNDVNFTISLLTLKFGVAYYF